MGTKEIRYDYKQKYLKLWLDISTSQCYTNDVDVDDGNPYKREKLLKEVEKWQ